MIRSLLVFALAFLAGAAVALVARTIRHDPHADAPEPPFVLEQAPMVSNALVPPPAPKTPAASATPPAPTPADASGRPVNTLCAICGMDVDPSLPTEQYQGRTIAFGCRACPPRFRAEPDKYGPAYLRNELYTP